MRHAYVVTWGTRSCIVAADSQRAAVDRIVSDLRVDTAAFGAKGPTADDVRVRDAEARDWRTLDYYGGNAKMRESVRAAMTRDQLTL